MRQQIEERLTGLKHEYDKGQTRIRQLESELASLREATLRISGAILVLQELLSQPAQAPAPGEEAPEPRRTQASPPSAAAAEAALLTAATQINAKGD
jgi:hypothetical protein